MGKRLKKDKDQSGTNMSRSNNVITAQVPKVILKRNESTDEGTFGTITYNDFTCYSGELRWDNNQPNISCIPKGVYVCHWTYSQKFKKMMYLLENVPNRGGIRIHSANLMGNDSKGFKRQLNGCIALGEKIGQIEGQKALLLSKPAIRRFEQLLNGKSFILEIR